MKYTVTLWLAMLSLLVGCATTEPEPVLTPNNVEYEVVRPKLGDPIISPPVLNYRSDKKYSSEYDPFIADLLAYHEYITNYLLMAAVKARDLDPALIKHIECIKIRREEVSYDEIEKPPAALKLKYFKGLSHKQAIPLLITHIEELQAYIISRNEIVEHYIEKVNCD